MKIIEKNNNVVILGAGDPRAGWGDTEKEIQEHIPEFSFKNVKVTNVTENEITIDIGEKIVIIRANSLTHVGENHMWRWSVFEEWETIQEFRKNGVAKVDAETIAVLGFDKNLDDSYDVRFVKDGPYETEVLKTEAWSDEPCFENVFEKFWDPESQMSWAQHAIERFHSEIMTEETDWEGIYGYDL